MQSEGTRWLQQDEDLHLMRHGTGDDDEAGFNDIRIDLRGGTGPSLNYNQRYNAHRYSSENDQRSQTSLPSRVSRYAEYPQVRPTNPLYSSQSTIKTHGSNPQATRIPSSKSSATLVNRRQKFDPQAPRRPSDWRWLAILCIFLFFPLGLFAFAFARKAQNKFRDGFVVDSHKLNKRALILCIASVLCGIALIIGLLFGFDAWPRTNG
ncbi:unnamed protein product [Rotaria magnacalcarata]|uniref:Uncharacterized protein n=6 Tax=Rotaria magnacalcarata TaxID=392030 RepID=A0A816AZP1_9BILA|nr:unnamed protein product [Rotaria magnacalcarata]CAF1603590.1 unnamed protein product [Rotaria magnacalcarata]CAF2065993.1 unnamed protein product [Rotaria magnacalcarata]CAF2113049.1 unnamed protein product [Rotaria magnacalcarata]CAF2265664.1 unnamed protein product [Rotaria magnacalcarata]